MTHTERVTESAAATRPWKLCRPVGPQYAALQWTGDNLDAVREFANAYADEPDEVVGNINEHRVLQIDTGPQHGIANVHPGDWLVVTLNATDEETPLDVIINEIFPHRFEVVTDA